MDHPGLGPPGAAPPAPDTSTIITLINAEISDINAQTARRGWNFWALVASAATCFGLLIAEMEKGLFALERVYAIWIFLGFSFFALRPIVSLMQSSIDEPKANRFFYARSLFLPRRWTILLLLAKWIFILYALNFVFKSSNNWFVTIGKWQAVFFITISIAILVMSRADFPVPGEWTRRKFSLVSRVFILGIQFLILVAPAIFVSWGAFGYIHTAPTSLTYSEIRIAAIGAAIFTIFYVLSGISREGYRLNELVAIRRDLALGNCEPTEASKRIQMVLMGRTIADHFSHDIERLLALLRESDIKMVETARTLGVFDSVGTSGTAAKMAATVLVDSITKQLGEIPTLLWSVARGRTAVSKSAYTIASLLAFDQSEREVFRYISGELDKRIDEYNALVQRAF